MSSVLKVYLFDLFHKKVVLVLRVDISWYLLLFRFRLVTAHSINYLKNLLINLWLRIDDKLKYSTVEPYSVIFNQKSGELIAPSLQSPRSWPGNFIFTVLYLLYALPYIFHDRVLSFEHHATAGTGFVIVVVLNLIISEIFVVIVFRRYDLVDERQLNG